jgi:hypothetical protein
MLNPSCPLPPPSPPQMASHAHFSRLFASVTQRSVSDLFAPTSRTFLVYKRHVSAVCCDNLPRFVFISDPRLTFACVGQRSGRKACSSKVFEAMKASESVRSSAGSGGGGGGSGGGSSQDAESEGSFMQDAGSVIWSDLCFAGNIIALIIQGSG